jgi:L-iditol 2-dehydrogenase
MCDEYRKTNLDPGGFAEYFRVPERNIERGGVLRIPPEVKFEVASLIEPVACSIRALDRSAASAGESALVVGAGPVGMIHSLLLKQMKAHVIVSDVNERRLKFAQEAEVGEVIDARNEGFEGAVKGLTGERGADLAVVASGNPKAVVQALKAVRKGGRVLLFGAIVKGSMLDYDLSDIFNSEVSIISSYGATEKETPKALDFIASGAIDFGRLITHRFHLDEFQQALKASEDGSGMKVILTSDASRGHS